MARETVILFNSVESWQVQSQKMSDLSMEMWEKLMLARHHTRFDGMHSDHCESTSEEDSLCVHYHRMNFD